MACASVEVIRLIYRDSRSGRCLMSLPGALRYSLHLSEMYGHNHAFFDPNIWHLDEELRKQVETFARCFILTGQEAPETSKKLHVDLYKKKPYQVTGSWDASRTATLPDPHVPYCWLDASRSQSNHAVHGSQEQHLQFDVSKIFGVEGKSKIHTKEILDQISRS